jgi:hypothetical protein
MSDNKEQCRAEFEFWYSDEGAHPKSIEKDVRGNYLLLGAAGAFQAWEAGWERRSAQPVALSDDLRDKVRDAVSAALGEAMDCTRVWSAWSYGTMGPDDFSVVANDDDRLEEIVDAALNAILAAKEQANGI